jgi:fermentation-respiration switch protein FrsA (DUF1100 family)
MKWLWRIAAGIVVVLVLAYVGVLGWIYTNQRALQYDPAGPLLTLTETTLTRAELVGIPSGGGAMLAGWFEPPQAGKPLIVYYRGNSGSFSREHERYEAMEADGFGFLAFDYRGFGGSPGTINQANILEDALAGFDWAAQKGFPLVIWGRSLRSGPATYLARERQADARVLETPFDSAVAVAHDRYWYLPVGLLMDD